MMLKTATVQTQGLEILEAGNSHNRQTKIDMYGRFSLKNDLI